MADEIKYSDGNFAEGFDPVLFAAGLGRMEAVSKEEMRRLFGSPSEQYERIESLIDALDPARTYFPG